MIGNPLPPRGIVNGHCLACGAEADPADHWATECTPAPVYSVLLYTTGAEE